jgi:hypothetical protein
VLIRISRWTPRPAWLVVQLVTRLDGMPLAIEPAARVEALGVAQLLARLGDRFALLAGADRLAPSRQRSLAAAVEWSYRLLGRAGTTGIPPGVGPRAGRRRRAGRRPGAVVAVPVVAVITRALPELRRREPGDLGPEDP